MRVIKFRGKRVDNGEWVYGDLLNCKNGDKRISWDDEITDEFFNNHLVIPESVGQMTTVKTDSIFGESVNLYEGDICEIPVMKPRSPNYHGSNDESKIFKATVEFEGVNPFFKNQQKGKSWQAWNRKQLHAMDIGGIKLIGTIHDKK